jgi:hypothetical protein
MENLILYTVPLEKERIGKPFDGGMLSIVYLEHMIFVLVAELPMI